MLTGQVLLTAGLSAMFFERMVARTKLGTILDDAPWLLGETRGGVLIQDNITAQLISGVNGKIAKMSISANSRQISAILQ